MLTTHDLRVTLLDVSPPVWRRIRVPSAVPLSLLHAIVQIAFGWENRHLHQWRFGDDEIDDQSDAGVTLAEMAPEDSSFYYDYDFGDGWEHLVEVLSIDGYDGSRPPLLVVDGARAAPPEDCGGPARYEDLLAALENPSDLEYEELLAAYGDRLDPDAFDRDVVNRRLEHLWRPGY